MSSFSVTYESHGYLNIWCFPNYVIEAQWSETWDTVLSISGTFSRLSEIVAKTCQKRSTDFSGTIVLIPKGVNILKTISHKIHCDYYELSLQVPRLRSSGLQIGHLAPSPAPPQEDRTMQDVSVFETRPVRTVAQANTAKSQHQVDRTINGFWICISIHFRSAEISSPFLME